MNWHVYIFLTTVWEEITKQDEDGNAQYTLPSNRRATQSADGTYTQIVGYLPEEISIQAFEHFSNKRDGSKKILDEFKISVNWHPADEWLFI